MTRAVLAVARALGRIALVIAVHGPVSRICCEGGRLVAVIWGRIYWRPLDGDWLASRWVPLALPGEEASGGGEAGTEARRKPRKPRNTRRRST